MVGQSRFMQNIKIMKNKNLKLKLANCENSIGSWVTIGHQAVVEVLAQSANFDWLTIDMEHTAIDFNEMQILIGFIQLHGISALVRVSNSDESTIKRVLDAGADGIIVPMVNNRESAIRAVSYAKYPPHGVRGVGLNRAQNYGYGFAEYWDWVREGLVIVVQIEHHEGVKNINEILSVEGIDGVFVGPYDLSCSLGVPGAFDSEEMKRALKSVELAAQKTKKSLGYHVIEPEISLVSEYLSRGYNFIAFSTDFLLMGRKASEEMKKLDYVSR